MTTKKETTKNTETNKISGDFAGVFADLNHVSTWDYDTEGFEYIKLKDYIKEHNNAPIVVHGFYINETDLGESVTIIANDAMVNLPSHAVEQFKKLDNEQGRELIKAGRLVLGNFTERHVKRFNNDTIYFAYMDAEKVDIKSL